MCRFHDMQHGCSHDAHLNKGVIDASSIGQEEATARGHAVKEEELLLGAQQAVIPLLGLLHTVLVVFHALLVWKGDSIDSLQQQRSPMWKLNHSIKATVSFWVVVLLVLHTVFG